MNRDQVIRALKAHEQELRAAGVEVYVVDSVEQANKILGIPRRGNEDSLRDDEL